MADDSEVSLPKSTLLKCIKELLPPDMRVAGDSVDMIVQCCNEFVHLISTQANEVSEAEKKKTINPEHILRALEQLGFDSYTAGVAVAWEEWKGEKKEHQKLVSKKSAALESGLTQEQLVELQRKLFEEARARTLSAASTPSAPAADGAQQQQQQQQQWDGGEGEAEQGGQHGEEQQQQQQEEAHEVHEEGAAALVPQPQQLQAIKQEDEVMQEQQPQEDQPPRQEQQHCKEEMAEEGGAPPPPPPGTAAAAAAAAATSAAAATAMETDLADEEVHVDAQLKAEQEPETEVPHAD